MQNLNVDVRHLYHFDGIFTHLTMLNSTKKILKLAETFKIKLADDSPEGKLEHASFRGSLNDWASGNSVKAINFNVHNNKFVEVKFNDAQILPVKEKDFKARFERQIVSLISPFEGWVTLEF